MKLIGIGGFPVLQREPEDENKQRCLHAIGDCRTVDFVVTEVPAGREDALLITTQKNCLGDPLPSPSSGICVISGEKQWHGQ